MKAPGIIMLVGGLVALALLGLTRLQSSEPASEPAPASAVDNRTSAAAPQRAPGLPPSQPAPAAPPPQAPSAAEPAPTAPAEPPTPQAVAAEPAPAAETARPAAPVPPPVPVEVQRRLTVAQQSADESERLRAVKWLGEHAGVPQFEALQQIQMNDPDPQVRRAAEDATNLLRVRLAEEEWPGVPRNRDPRDYMRGVPEPSR